jgi:hypothetical protein
MLDSSVSLKAASFLLSLLPAFLDVSKNKGFFKRLSLNPAAAPKHRQPTSHANTISFGAGGAEGRLPIDRALEERTPRSSATQTMETPRREGFLP